MISEYSLVRQQGDFCIGHCMKRGWVRCHVAHQSVLQVIYPKKGSSTSKSQTNLADVPDIGTCLLILLDTAGILRIVVCIFPKTTNESYFQSKRYQIEGTPVYGIVMTLQLHRCLHSAFHF